jgi:CBS domain containing-hemolysin-like protein
MRRVFEAVLLALSIIGFLLLAITPHMETSFLTQYGKIISMFLAIPHILFYWILGSFAMLFLTSGRS